MDFPSPSWLRARFGEWGVPVGVRRHLERVRDVGVLIAGAMAGKAGAGSVDVGLVEAGCLVHDAFKAATFEKFTAFPEFEQPEPTERELGLWRKWRRKYAGMHETRIAEEELRGEWPEFAGFVASLGLWELDARAPCGLERDVVHYADWRVQFVKLVPLKQRLEYFRKTYGSRPPGKGAGWWEALLEHELKVEKRLFKGLGFGPGDVARLVPGKEFHERLCAVKAVVLRGGRVLLLKRREGDSHGGEWDLPGGAVEDGESLESALKREVLEEAGLVVKVGRKLAEWEFSKQLPCYGRVKVAGTAFLCVASGGQVKLGGEHSRFKWALPGGLGEGKWNAGLRKTLSELAAGG